MESGRLYFDNSACRVNNNNNMSMLFLGNADLGFRGDYSLSLSLMNFPLIFLFLMPFFIWIELNELLLLLLF